MKELRSVLEEDLKDIPTKPIGEEKKGFYLFVHGCVNEALQGTLTEDGGVVKHFKTNASAKYHFPIAKKDLAMFVFVRLNELSCENSRKYVDSFEYVQGHNCIVKQFMPRTESYIIADEITKVSMFLCSEGGLSEVVYDPEYKVKLYKEICQQEMETDKHFKDTDKTILSYGYKYN
ncbi:MAG: hypothetical protein HFJ19_04695 [Clostridia bacterium]|nr:hypothetical protein [Clostridia bacterium]